jgi:hypothetical protein
MKQDIRTARRSVGMRFLEILLVLTSDDYGSPRGGRHGTIACGMAPLH